MIANIKSVLNGLTKEVGTDETSSAFGLSLTQQGGGSYAQDESGHFR